jgi:hypothetical protein
VNEDHLKRKEARIALLMEFGGDAASFKLAAKEAVRRGLYSKNTPVGDIESTLKRAWLKRNRKKSGK